MTETQSHLEDLFAAALELRPEERQRFLDRACGNGRALRHELGELLASERAAAEYFDDLARSIAAAASVELESAARPRVEVGPYRTVQVIGSGGMGVVYRAVRIDGEFDQEVALKLMHLDMETPEMRARFLAERQLLARLSHPRIARLLDGGVTHEGRPYFVMEHVEGLPITSYCLEQKLTVDHRLRLFSEVIEAVSYLHRNLIVHRDLKPSNIFVDRERRVKLLDFGIAKLLAEEGEQPGRTRTGEQLLTPGYAAPEQLTGGAITTATDVYALGCVLFELLTGRRPFERSPNGTSEVPDRIPTAPSSVLHALQNEGAELARSPISWRRVAGDLDTICLEALRPEPEQRYASAEQLGDDIVRYLEGLPIRARKATLGYRLGKFIGRHRQGVVALFLLLALLSLGFARERGLRGTAEVARVAADREAAKASAISSFLGELLSSVEPAKAQGQEVTVREVLDQAAERLETTADSAEQIAVEAALRRTIGNTYQTLSRFDEAKTHLDRAVELSGGLEATTPEALEAILTLASLHYRREEFVAASTLARRVLEVRTEMLGEDHLETLAAMNLLANALWAQGLYEEVEPLDRKTVEIRRRVLGDDHPDTLRSLNGLAATLFNGARYLEAADLFQQVLAAQTRVLGPSHPDTLTAGNNLGACYMELCFYGKAEEVLRPVLEGRLQVLGEEDPLTWTTIHNLGAVLAPLARYEEAETLLRRAAAHRRGMTGDLRNYFFTRSYLADVIRDRGRHHEAESIYLETLEEQRRRYGPEDAQTLKTATGLSDLRLRQGRLHEAEALLDEVLEKLPAIVGGQHPDLLGSRTILARVRNAQGRHEEALALTETVLATAGPSYDDEHPLVLDAKMEQLLALRGLERFEEASVLAAVVHEGRVHRLGQNHPRTVEALEWIGKPRLGD